MGKYLWCKQFNCFLSQQIHDVVSGRCSIEDMERFGPLHKYQSIKILFVIRNDNNVYELWDVHAMSSDFVLNSE